MTVLLPAVLEVPQLSRAVESVKLVPSITVSPVSHEASVASLKLNDKNLLEDSLKVKISYMNCAEKWLKSTNRQWSTTTSIPLGPHVICVASSLGTQ